MSSTSVSYFRTLLLNDLKLIGRDTLLAWMLVYPPVVALVLRWLLPELAGRFREGFDLTVYYPVLAGYFLLTVTPVLLGVITGFILLDERDDDTLTALKVTPLPGRVFIVYRILGPAVISIVMTPLMFYIADLMTVNIFHLLTTTILVSLEAPIITLFLVLIAGNKVQGFALMKGLATLMMIPVLSWFVKSDIQLLAGIVPNYWPIKAIWASGAEPVGFWIYTAVGLAYHLVLLGYLIRLFGKKFF